MIVALILFTLLGHVAIWVGIANRIHAFRVPQWFNIISSYVCHSCLIGLPIFIGWWQFQEPSPANIPAAAMPAVEPDEDEDLRPVPRANAVVDTPPANAVAQRNPMFRRAGWPILYYAYCWGVGGVFIVWWIVWRLTARPPRNYTPGPCQVIDTTQTLGRRPARNLFAKIVTRLPLNEVFQVSVDEKTFALPQLPPDFSPLVIAHISDWHLKGRIDRDYFEEVVRLTNETRPDLICVTGDLFDKPEFLDWIPTTFARLQARLGVAFILGNHDIRHPATERSCELLREAGLHDVGRAPWEINDGGRLIYLAGNELPWLPLSPQLWADLDRDAQDMKKRPADLRILLSHSPDQIKWAARHQFDLMLAGHTHGGQIRLPLIGAVYAPSWYGVKYASGVFASGRTLVHVTRGIGGEFPFRWNCRPEVARLSIRPAP